MSRHILYTGYIISSKRMTYQPEKGHGYGHMTVTLLKFCHLMWWVRHWQLSYLLVYSTKQYSQYAIVSYFNIYHATVQTACM